MWVVSYLLLLLKCKFSKIKRQMFTGIIETLGIVKGLTKQDGNLHITVSCLLTSELKIDQSVAHNGVCLTVVSIENNNYTVTAIQETIEKTNVGDWKEGDYINLERAMKLGVRLDQTGFCKSIEETNGSWLYTFSYDSSLNNITIEKGSITVNGVSLTVVNSLVNEFSVAIIPYTYEHTNFHNFNVGTKVNLEFDVIGKYVSKLHSLK
jgi:riboflavin synthase